VNIARLGASLISALPIGLGRATRQLAAEVVYRQRHLKGLIKARKYRIGGQCRAAALRVGDAGQVSGALHGDRPMEIDRHSNDRKSAETESRALRDVADRIVEALHSWRPFPDRISCLCLAASCGRLF